MTNGFIKLFKQFFSHTEVNYAGIPTYRLHLMRILFVLTFLLLGKAAWTKLITHNEIWNPLEGVAYSFWAAYSTLMILGLRRPLEMTPLLLLQFFYKLVWLIGVAFPLWQSNHIEGTEQLVIVFSIGVVLDIIAMPWVYVYQKYVPFASSRKRVTANKSN